MAKKLEIVQPIKLHNKHHLVLTDAKTGEVKQEGWAYNIVLDAGITAILSNFKQSVRYYATSCRLFDYGTESTTYAAYHFGTYAHIGEGTGTLDATRTSLFTFTAGIATTLHEKSISEDEMTATIVRKAVFDELTAQNTSISEVGLAGYSSGSYLRTHALIEDSEGNPITIAKGTTDILTVYSTVYFELQAVAGVEYQKSGHLIGQASSGSNNLRGLSNWFMDRFYHDCVSGDPDATLQWLVIPVQAIPFASMDTLPNSWTSDPYTLLNYNDNRVAIDGKKFTFGIANVLRIPYNYRSGVAVKGLLVVGANYRRNQDTTLYETNSRVPMLLFRFPITGVYEGTSLTGDVIDVGDGSETEFNFTWDDWELDTEVVRVDGVVKTRTTDYTTHNGVGKGKNIFQFCDVIETSGITNLNEDPTTMFIKLPDAGCTDGTMNIALQTEDRSTTVAWEYPAGNEPYIVLESDRVQYADSFSLKNNPYWGAKDFKLQGWNDVSEEWVDILDTATASGDAEQTFTFASEVGYKKWKYTIYTIHGYSTNQQFSTYAYVFHLNSSRPHITFNTAPADTLSIEADYDVEYIPKDENHVIDLEFSIQLGDGNAV